MDTIISDFNGGQIALVGFACCLGSLLIGAVGIGGVIVVPALILCKVPPELAIVTVFVSFQPATWMKLLLVGRLEGLIAWRTALPAAVMATIGSATGGMLVTRAPRRILAFSVASFALFAALVDVFKFVRAWRERQAAGQNANTTQGTADAPGQEHVEGVPKDGSLAGGPPVGTLDIEIQSAGGTHREIAGASEQSQGGESHGEPRAAQQDAPQSMCERIRSAYFIPMGDPIPLHMRWDLSSSSYLEIGSLSLIGLMTGLGSVLTGTGGPLIFMPVVLMWKGSAVHPKVLVGIASVPSPFHFLSLSFPLLSLPALPRSLALSLARERAHLLCACSLPPPSRMHACTHTHTHTHTHTAGTHTHTHSLSHTHTTQVVSWGIGGAAVTSTLASGLRPDWGYWIFFFGGTLTRYLRDDRLIGIDFFRWDSNSKGLLLLHNKCVGLIQHPVPLFVCTLTHSRSLVFCTRKRPSDSLSRAFISFYLWKKKSGLYSCFALALSLAFGWECG